jgi:hypothetical protein
MNIPTKYSRYLKRQFLRICLLPERLKTQITMIVLAMESDSCFICLIAFCSVCIASEQEYCCGRKWLRRVLKREINHAIFNLMPIRNISQFVPDNSGYYSDVNFAQTIHRKVREKENG